MFKFLWLTINRDLAIVLIPLFEITKFPIHVFLRYWSHIQYQVFMSCFLEDIDPIFKNFKRSIRHIFRIFQCASFPIFQRTRYSRSGNFENKIFQEWLGIFLEFCSNLVSPKLKNNWFGESWTRPTIQTSWKWWLSGVSQSEIKKLQIQYEAE